MKRALFVLFAAAACLPAMADQALATSKNCMACHAV
ncbi:MAG TPA: cytochrome C', partial [Ramlibacter sp.]